MIDRLVYLYCYFYLFFPLINSTRSNFRLSSDETRLIRRLVNETTYLRKVKPSNKVIVDIRLIFNQIISMVEKEQIIVTNCFVDQKWTGKRRFEVPSHNRATASLPFTTITRSSSRVESTRFQ
jgi:hypothetical protein